METRNLLHTDLTVSRACLGTMAFGSQTNEAMAARMIDVCIDRGLNFLDTSNVYNFGEAETILGNILKGRRDRFILASKVRMKMGDLPGDSGLSRNAVLRNVDESLRRLRTDYLDLYYLHMPDSSVPIEETLETMDKLVRIGKVRYPGVSNYAAWQICQILWVCEKSGYRPPVVSQPMYNLLARGIEQEYVPFCREFGISMVVYNPLARGLLAGKPQLQEALSVSSSDSYQSVVDRYRHPAFHDAINSLEVTVTQHGRSMIDLALNWLLHHTAADCVILGAWNIEQLEENLDVLELGPLSTDILSSCEIVSRTLRGIVPKYNR